MRTPRRQRLLLCIVSLAALSGAVALGLSALQQNINLFFSPTEVRAGEAPRDRAFRIGGMVVNNSVVRNATDLQVTFDLTDTASTVSVSYTGILPDLFREGQGIVALGRLQGNQFIAQQVLAKHDETYMPPEVSEALKAANQRYQGAP